MDIIKNFSFDKEASEQGKWFPLGPKERIKMRSMSSAHSRAVRAKLEAPWKITLNAGGTLEDFVTDQMAKDQFVESLIVDWEGLTNDGEEFPYSKANAIRMMNEAEGFVDFLSRILMSPDAFASVADENEVKN